MRTRPITVELIVKGTTGYSFEYQLGDKHRPVWVQPIISGHPLSWRTTELRDLARSRFSCSKTPERAIDRLIAYRLTTPDVLA